VRWLLALALMLNGCLYEQPRVPKPAELTCPNEPGGNCMPTYIKKIPWSKLC